MKTNLKSQLALGLAAATLAGFGWVSVAQAAPTNPPTPVVTATAPASAALVRT